MDKEKQIEKMACDICPITHICRGAYQPTESCYSFRCAKVGYEKGYSKQSEGEWETIPDYSRSLITYRHICSECKAFYKDIRPNGHKFCHECGAKMKG